MKKIKYYENIITNALAKTTTSEYNKSYFWKEINEQQFYKKLSILKSKNKTLYCFYGNKIMQV